jgi:hypothetical protein
MQEGYRVDLSVTTGLLSVDEVYINSMKRTKARQSLLINVNELSAYEIVNTGDATGNDGC